MAANQYERTADRKRVLLVDPPEAGRAAGRARADGAGRTRRSIRRGPLPRYRSVRAGRHRRTDRALPRYLLAELRARGQPAAESRGIVGKLGQLRPRLARRPSSGP